MAMKMSITGSKQKPYMQAQQRPTPPLRHLQQHPKIAIKMAKLAKQEKAATAYD